MKMTLRESEQSIFLQAIELAPDEARARFLDEACQGDSSLRDALDKLITAHDRLDAKPSYPADAAFSVTSPTIYEGDGDSEYGETRIDAYKLLQKIGEGGMGAVYMAEQLAPVRRTVALKLIRPWMDGRQSLARFEVERQALALMDHPNIAKVLDAGATESGRPYVVMELVKGVPITQFCDEQRLTPRQRLELFVPVCEAIQHAHQKGIIHRDLKPSNILVGLYDGRPVPKVIDFGVAKVIGPKLTEHTLFTNYGTVIGTPEYMSPEQALLDNVDIDTRSDLYSLGVLLYELLTGSPPLDRKRLKTLSLLEVLRIVREQEHQKPSTRLGASETLSSIASNRGVEPRQLRGLLRGEVDWIVMRCLEKERARRYGSAAELAADLRSHLDNLPVQACPPSAAYRVKKFTSRHRRAVVTTAAVMLLAVAGMATGTALLWRAKNEAQAVNQLALRFMDSICLRLVEERAPKNPLRSKEDAALLGQALEFYQEFAAIDRSNPEVREVVRFAYRRMSAILMSLQRYERAKEVMRRCIEIDQQRVAENPRDAWIRLELAISYGVLANAEMCGGEHAESQAHVTHAVGILDRFSRGDVAATSPKYYWAMGRGHHWLGIGLLKLGTLEQAESFQRKAVQFMTRALGEGGADDEHLGMYKQNLVMIEIDLAEVLRMRGKRDEAEGVYREALDHGTRFSAEISDSVADDMAASGYSLNGEMAAAHLALSELTVGDDSKDHAARSAEMLRRMTAAYPGVAFHRERLTSALRRQSAVLEKHGGKAGATASYAEAAKLGQKLIDEKPDHLEYQKGPSQDREYQTRRDQRPASARTETGGVVP